MAGCDGMPARTQVARRRHHAELCAIMCLHKRNALDLAIEMCNHEPGYAGAGEAECTSYSLEAALRAEQV